MQLGEAIRRLYPAADPRHDFRVLVPTHLDKDGNTVEDPPQIVYWDTAKLGPQPDLATLQAAAATYDAAQAQQASDTAALRTLVRQKANSAVGVAYDSLNAAQVKALLWILLHKEDALNADLTVKPLAQWAKD